MEENLLREKFRVASYRYKVCSFYLLCLLGLAELDHYTLAFPLPPRLREYDCIFGVASCLYLPASGSRSEGRV